VLAKGRIFQMPRFFRIEIAEPAHRIADMN